MGQDPVDGVCHDSVRNGCSAGTPNDAALADTSNAYKWRCDGLHGGQDSRICFIRVEDVVDGVCDESRRNDCSAGTPNAAAYPGPRPPPLPAPRLRRHRMSHTRGWIVD